MTSLLRKKYERFFLERFIEAAGLCAEIVEEREGPDFLIRFEGRLIGVELTQLFVLHNSNGVLPQAQESISDRILFRARQIYEASGACAAHISVVFVPNHELRQISREATASELAGVVSGMELSVWKRVDWRPRHQSPLGGVVSLIQALGVPSRDVGQWRAVRAGWVAPLTVDVIQSRIDEKAKRLAEYQGEIVENWLLIFADGMRPSQFFEIRAAFEPSRVVSPFARAYFYCHWDRTVVQLGSRVKRQSAI